MLLLDIRPTSSPKIPAHAEATSRPTLEDFLFEWRFFDDTLIYRGVAGDFVMFLAYSGPGGGHGGREFILRTTTGRHVLKGPWSSREGVVHHVFPDRPMIVDTVLGFISADAIVHLGHTVRTTYRRNEKYAYVSS
jgi:hypothetical protein